MEYIYQAKLDKDPDVGFIVTFPDVPEAITAGDNREEALQNATEALGLALRGYLADEKELPKSTKHKDGIAIPVDAWNALKLAVIEAFAAADMTKTELARRLGRGETEARRILDPDHPTKLQLLQQALTVLGKQVIISIKNAA